MPVKKYEKSDPGRGNTPGIWSAFDAIKAVRYSHEWQNNVTRTNLEIFKDISSQQLPAVSWITPNAPNSDHPGESSDTGPSWVASIVNAIGKSSYWKTTAIVIVWDDWGGLYDHVVPPAPSDVGRRTRLPRSDVDRFAVCQTPRRSHRLRVRQHPAFHRRHLGSRLAAPRRRSARRASGMRSTSTCRRASFIPSHRNILATTSCINHPRASRRTANRAKTYAASNDLSRDLRGRHRPRAERLRRRLVLASERPAGRHARPLDRVADQTRRADRSREPKLRQFIRNVSGRKRRDARQREGERRRQVRRQMGNARGPLADHEERLAALP